MSTRETIDGCGIALGPLHRIEAIVLHAGFLDRLHRGEVGITAPVPRRSALPEPEDGEEMARPNHDGRCADGSQSAQEHGMTPAEEAIVVAFRQKTLRAAG
jgi:hypothetical protein